MSRIRIVGGTITKTTVGDHNIYSDGNIVYSSGKAITETSDVGIMYGEPKDAPVRKAEKKIIEMYWTYGDTRLSDKSRFYVDMNLHVKTQNYKEGESIVVFIKSKDGQPLTDDKSELSLTAIIGKEDMVIFEKVLKDYTLNLLENED